MALTASEQLQLMSGAVAPPNTDLISLVYQTAYMFVKTFDDNYKEEALEIDYVTDPANPAPVLPLANTYINKLFGVVSRISKDDKVLIVRLTRMIVVIIGASGADLATLQAASQTQWESFIDSNIDEAIEYIARVKRDERVEYQAIP
tara:strand:+ start:179 stop:619 length:441 start_codon:yes stop_codon:yes gene_type:complete